MAQTLGCKRQKEPWLLTAQDTVGLSVLFPQGELSSNLERTVAIGMAQTAPSLASRTLVQMSNVKWPEYGGPIPGEKNTHQK